MSAFLQEKKLKENNKFTPLNFIMLLISGTINASAVTLFLTPVHLYDSGFSGTSMLLAQLTPESFSLSMFLLILNIPFFLYGCKKQGLIFTVYSIFAVFIYSAASYIFQNILPLDLSEASPIAGQDLLLCAIFGGLISGVGSGMTIRFGGAIDGIEVMAVIFAKRLSLTVGNFVMIYNTILYIFAGIAMHSFILPLYSILTYSAGIITVDFFVDGFDKVKSAMIITTKGQEISSELSAYFKTGVTNINARGFYDGNERTVIYFVVNRFQIRKLKEIVSQIDPYSFVTISEVSDIMRKSI